MSPRSASSASASTPAPSLASSALIPLDQARVRLAILWLAGAGLIFLLFIVQSLLNVYREFTTEAWGWILPTLMPTLTLIVTVLTYTALDPNSSTSVVRKAFLAIAFWLSLFYLVSILLTILVQPFSAGSAKDAIALMKMSNLWLGPFQGLVASSLGVLFASKQKS